MSRTKPIGLTCLLGILATLARADISAELTEKPASPFRAAATFGAAEALRALERLDEAVAKLTALVRDKEWAARAQLRLAELYIAKADATDARRVLDDIQPRSLAERKER